jgi:hypothetical protein
MCIAREAVELYSWHFLETKSTSFWHVTPCGLLKGNFQKKINFFVITDVRNSKPTLFAGRILFGTAYVYFTGSTQPREYN